jgi:hypothetical protein
MSQLAKAKTRAAVALVAAVTLGAGTAAFASPTAKHAEVHAAKRTEITVAAAGPQFLADAAPKNAATATFDPAFLLW